MKSLVRSCSNCTIIGGLFHDSSFIFSYFIFPMSYFKLHAHYPGREALVMSPVPHAPGPLPQPSRTKVMFLIWSLDQGGAEQVVLNLAIGLDRQKFEPVICCLNEKGRYAFRAEAAGIRIEALGKRGRVDFGFLGRLTKLIRREKIDLIHSHLFTSNLWGRVASWITGVPIVSTEHNVDHWKKPYHFWMDRIVACISAKVICVSKKVEDFYLEKVPALRSRTLVIYNGIDTEFFKPGGEREKVRERLGIPVGRLIAGAVGRLVPQKRQQDFIEALAQLKRAGQNVGGILVGDGPERSALEKKAQEAGLTKEIIFTGFCDNTPELYAAMDVFVLCSEREGFPMTVLEAMAAGLPVVATDVGGVSECVENGKTGFLIQPGDPEAIAHALLRLFANTDIRTFLAQNAGELVRNEFSIMQMAERHEELYSEVLRTRIKE